MSEEPPSLDIEVIVEAGDWSPLGPDLDGFVSETIMAALAGLRRRSGSGSGSGWPGPFALSVTFLDDAAMRDINRDHRDQDKPTNVLSFPAFADDDLDLLAAGGTPAGLPPGIAAPLGDILMARETVAREALAQGKSFGDHARHLLVHGFLHLAGYDHISDHEAAEMEALEVEILKAFAIADPYQIIISTNESHNRQP